MRGSYCCQWQHFRSSLPSHQLSTMSIKSAKRCSTERNCLCFELAAKPVPCCSANLSRRLGQLCLVEEDIINKDITLSQTCVYSISGSTVTQDPGSSERNHLIIGFGSLGQNLFGYHLLLVLKKNIINMLYRWIYFAAQRLTDTFKKPLYAI